ncbi:MAG: hypothetical protein ACM3UO_00540 [Bacillota bacterium]
MKMRGSRLPTQIGARGKVAEMAQAVPAVVGQANTEMVERSARLGGRIAAAIRAARLALAGRELVDKQRAHTHRIRHAVLFTAVGAVAAFFLDPQSGASRRSAARRATSSVAQTAGRRIGTPSEVATPDAEDTAPDPVVA